MNIENQALSYTEFGDVGEAEVFSFEGTAYMKLDGVDCSFAVQLQKGFVVPFNDTTRVQVHSNAVLKLNN